MMDEREVGAIPVLRQVCIFCNAPCDIWQSMSLTTTACAENGDGSGVEFLECNSCGEE